MWLLLGAGSAQALPTFDEVRAAHRPSDTVVLDRFGDMLQRVRTDATVRRGSWIALADVSPALRTALVLSEDKRFYEHSGVDWQAVSAAAWGNLWNKRTRGASTLTMQLAGLLDGDWRASAGGRSVTQKLGQTVAAQVLDRRWRKDQILEAYLNLVPFRGELVGVDALSRTLFGKAPHGLDQREAAVAAALLRAPNAKAAQVAQRACGIERAVAQVAKADCDGLDLFVTGALQRRALEASSGIAPHFARRFLGEARTASRMQATPRSSLDASLQRFATQSLQQHLRELRQRNVEDGAVLVLDNQTGEVLAWVGSSGELSQATEVDAVLAPRQPGSTLKPFLYAQAIAEKRLTAASLLEDAPTHIPTASGLYIPQNYDHQFKGWVSARTALAASLNVPAVRTLVMVGPERFQSQLNRLGMGIKESGDYYGYSLALGSAEVSLLNLSNAYRALANGGVWRPTRMSPEAPSTASERRSTEPAIDASAAFIVGDILSDTHARARTFGTDSLLATRHWSAVKTGTSKDMRDNWALGYSRRYTVGVWVGNASGAAMHDVSGTSGAAPIWAAVMDYLHRNARPADKLRPPAPPGLLAQQVRFGNEQEAQREEWFLPGTAQAVITTDLIANNADIYSQNRQLGAKITSPAHGSVLALDPDIPPQRQRVSLQASPVSVVQAARLRWTVDGKPLGSGANQQWLPWPGRHVVRLSLADGTVLDEVKLEVRGAGVRAKAPSP